MCPSLLQTVPVPPLHLPAPTWTTDRDTRSVTSTIASETDSRIADELVCLLIFSPTPVGVGWPICSPVSTEYRSQSRRNPCWGCRLSGTPDAGAGGLACRIVLKRVLVTGGQPLQH